MANENEILSELREIRERMLEESGGTLTGLVNMLREEEARSKRAILVDLDANSPQSDGSAAENA